MRGMWSYATILLQVFCPYLASAATLPPSVHLTSNRNPLSNNSHEDVKCLPRPNATYPIYDSPLELAMTFGHHQILSWQVTTFLQYVLIDIKPNASRYPNDYVPRGFYFYHELGHLGKVSVIPSFYNHFTWSDLYLVLHALAEYIVKAPHAYEMCVKVDFRAGGLAGVIFLDWWTSDAPTKRSLIPVRDARNLRQLESGFRAVPDMSLPLG